MPDFVREPLLVLFAGDRRSCFGIGGGGAIKIGEGTFIAAREAFFGIVRDSEGGVIASGE